MHHRHLPLFEQALKTGHARVEAVLIVNLAQFVGANANLGAQAVIGVIRIGHQGVETVVGAGEFHHHQDALVVCCERGVAKKGQGSA